jgi:acyl carrier protein
MSITDRIISVIKRNESIKNIEELDANSNLKNDLGMDSLERIMFFLDIENEFQITILDEHIKHIQTIKDLEGFISQYLSKEFKGSSYFSLPISYFYLN